MPISLSNGDVALSLFGNIATIVGISCSLGCFFAALCLLGKKKWSLAGTVIAMGTIWAFIGLCVIGIVNCLVASTYCGNLPAPPIWMLIHSWGPQLRPLFWIIGWIGIITVIGLVWISYVLSSRLGLYQLFDSKK